MSFFAAWLHTPPDRSRLSRYTEANGYLYVALGAGLFALPNLPQLLLGMPAWQGYEEGMVRLIGFVLVIIGYFYAFGGRTGATSFGLSTVVDRALVPVFLLPLVFSGAVPAVLVAPVAILDPLLGLGAYLIWRSER
jgi:hypothetical protein